ncbi:MFS general substrate transporter [Ceraceosorus guamensis]|uniref:MFS general substrate transporter n=1 Tax=Ceraceosorus guamensis TaxID=1522189 RepID=A0A316W4I6_9BASI|nr:MFS general substrate transporter [Ceraceosorus guamensis]PWN44780.1 MFS general substrate transporter [Ceraceosorus guamensis]
MSRPERDLEAAVVAVSAQSDPRDSDETQDLADAAATKVSTTLDPRSPALSRTSTTVGDAAPTSDGEVKSEEKAAEILQSPSAEKTRPDVEKLEATASQEDGSEPAKDVILVTWDSPESLENPRNWSRARKWSVVNLISIYALLAAAGSSVCAPALPEMAEEFGVTSEIQRNLMLSIFVLAFALGPLVLAPISEVYGRTLVLQITTVFFVIFMIACCVAQNYAQIVAFRFLAGLGGSASLVVGGGSISDMFINEQRGSAMSLYSMGPLLGPCVGPIIGGFIVQELQEWRWTFGVVAIGTAAFSVIGFLLLRESYPPRILALKAARLRKQTGDHRYTTQWIQQDLAAGGWAARFSRHLERPVVMLTTQPLVIVFSLYSALLYGTLYILITTFDGLFVNEYGMKPGIASLNYIALSVGCLIGSLTCGRMTDHVYKKLQARHGGVGIPEYKLPIMMVQSFLIPIGMLIYAWTAGRTHWIGPDVGAAVFTFGNITVRAYLVDCYQLYASSVLSANNLARNIAAFAFPLAAPALFGDLGYGVGGTIIAVLAAVLGIPSPFLFWKYGPRLRAASNYARDAV